MMAGQAPAPATRQAIPPYLVIAALAITGVLMVAPLYGAIPLLPLIAREFGGNLSSAGLIVFAFGFAYAVACLYFGPLSDVVGRRNVMLFGVLAEGLLSILCAASPSPSMLIMARVAQGFAAGTFGPVAIGYVAEAYTGPLRHAGVSVLSTGLIASGSIAQIAAQVLADAFGWRSFFVGCGALELVLGGALFALVREPAVDRTGRSLLRAYVAERSLLGSGAIRACYLVGFILYGGFVLYYAAIGPHVAGAFGRSGQTVLLVRAIALPGMLLTIFAGPLIDRFAAHRVVASGMVVAVAGLVLSILGARNGVELTVGSAVYSLGFAFAAVSMNTVITELSGAARGTAMAFFVFVSFTGASVAPILFSRLAPFGFAATLGTLAVATALGWFLMTMTVRRGAGAPAVL